MHKQNSRQKEVSEHFADGLHPSNNENDAGDNNPNLSEEETAGLLKLTAKEISKMDKSFSNTLIANGRILHYRKRVRGKKSCSYEIRYRRDGYNISFSAPTLPLAKLRFLEATSPEAMQKNKLTSVPTTFCDFAEYYLEKFWKRKVKPETYKSEMYRYARNLKPYFGKVQMSRITPESCQRLLDTLTEKGYGKTCDEVYSILNGIFKAAIKHSIISNNPLDMVIHTRHEREHGKALTKDEEKLLLAAYRGTKYETLFAVALYTGLRPNEYKTARIEGEFIIAVNSKQKNGKTAYKKIPITPMLRPYPTNVEKLQFPGANYMRNYFNAVLNKHTLKDLRTTFNTRCIECGISDIARKRFMGHSLGAMGDTYTDLSDDYLIAEGSKFKY